MSGWSLVDHTRRKKKPKQPKVPKDPVSEEKAEEPCLNPLFKDPAPEKSRPEPVYELPPKPSNEWQLVGEPKKKNRNKERAPPPPDPTPEVKPKPQSTSKKRRKKKKGPVLTERQQDEARARRALRTGDKLEAWSMFYEKWVTAEVVGTQGEELTLKTLDGRQLELRTSEKIRPLFDESRKQYRPFPVKKERKQKKAAQATNTKKKVKRKKKNTAKKVTTEDEIKGKIHDIIKNFGDKDRWGLTEIQNKLSAHLQGGQWNSKTYKSKYGTFKKFVSRHADDFTTMENGGKVVVQRLEPVIVPTPTKIDLPLKKKDSESSSIFLPMVLLMLCVVAAMVVFLISNPEVELSKIKEMVTNILQGSTDGKEL